MNVSKIQFHLASGVVAETDRLRTAGTVEGQAFVEREHEPPAVFTGVGGHVSAVDGAEEGDGPERHERLTCGHWNWLAASSGHDGDQESEVIASDVLPNR